MKPITFFTIALILDVFSQRSMEPSLCKAMLLGAAVTMSIIGLAFLNRAEKNQAETIPEESGSGSSKS